MFSLSFEGSYHSLRYGCEMWVLRLTEREVARERFIVPLYFALRDNNKEDLESLYGYEQAHYGKQFDDSKIIVKTEFPWVLADMRKYASEVIERAAKCPYFSDERREFIIMNAKLLVKQINTIEQAAKDYMKNRR